MLSLRPVPEQFHLKMMEAVYEELNAPSANKLYKVLKDRGHAFTMKDVTTFVKGQTERQVQAPDYDFKGKIASQDLNVRWHADLIDFTAAPSKGGGVYILVVQDVFSRKLYTESLENKQPETVRDGFIRIMNKTRVRVPGRRMPPRIQPVKLTVDEGPEFKGLFEGYVNALGIMLQVKQKIDINAMATLDNAIGQFKKALARDLRRNNTNDWSSRLEKVTKGYNMNPNEEYLEGSTPNDVVPRNKEFIEHLRVKNAGYIEHNQDRADKREHALSETNAFRTAIPRGNFTRSFKPKWSETVKTVNTMAAATVTDTAGEKYLTKFTRAVPAASAEGTPSVLERPGSEQTRERQLRFLAPYVEALRNRIGLNTDMSVHNAVAFLRGRPGFIAALRQARLNAKSLISNLAALRPEYFQLIKRGGRMHSVRRIS